MTTQPTTRITDFEIYDVRFPTSRELDGSDAMNPSPDYSAAYLRLFTSDPKSRFGDGFVFTIGDGNDVQLAAVEHVAKRAVGLGVDDLSTSMGEIARDLTGSSPWRWLGPEKGIAHMASGAVINALWDIRARREGLPLWDVLASMTPDDLVDLVDFRYLEDAITRTEAMRLLAEAQPGRERRKALLRTEGYPAYSTTPGWLGYSDEKMVNLCRAAAAQGFPLIKLKVGRDLTDDIRRLSLARDALGDSFAIAVDANQTWGVEEAISWVGELAKYNPYWVEEPTSPDDILGHARIAESISPIRVATGEHVHNRVMFKQFLQARAVDVVQLDATRVGGINENIAIILLAAKYGKPVCPHAGGVGLCEVVQHLAMFDFVAVSGSIDGRMIEYVDHLHEHFATPVQVRDGRYYPPERPGTGATMQDESLANFRYPLGQAWSRAEPPTD